MESTVDALLPQVRADLERLVRIGSVSADAAAAPLVQESAEAVAELVQAAGVPDVEIVRVGDGQPAVLGRRPAPAGAPTVLLYAHHDVQPTGDLSLWESPPFEPVERGGRLFGRGAADDKAGIAVHLAALRALGDELPVGVTVLVEGEEEIGSPTLPDFLSAYGDRLAADVIVLTDSTNWAVGVPALTTSLRGGGRVVVEVRTLDHAVHSGMYGGPVPDALTALCRLVATLHDDAGDVAVAGLRRDEADPLDLTEERLRADAGVLDGVELIGTGSLTSRLWRAPSISVLGIDAPSIEGAAGSLVPSARAAIGLRTAPGDDPAAASDALVAHLTAHAPWGAQLTVTPGRPIPASELAADGPAYTAARAALAEAWGRPSVDIGVGGSIPFIASFASAFPGAEILVTGVEDPDTRAHGANESLHLGEWRRACLAEALFLARLGG
jgi:acetylornithine deacetylase/succinyl-diaminopimelate desuccinylase-like protein